MPRPPEQYLECLRATMTSAVKNNGTLDVEGAICVVMCLCLTLPLLNTFHAREQWIMNMHRTHNPMRCLDEVIHVMMTLFLCRLG